MQDATVGALVFWSSHFGVAHANVLNGSTKAITRTVGSGVVFSIPRAGVPYAEPQSCYTIAQIAFGHPACTLPSQVLRCKLEQLPARVSHGMPCCLHAQVNGQQPTLAVYIGMWIQQIIPVTYRIKYQ